MRYDPSTDKGNTSRLIPKSKVKGRFERGRHRLYPYRPRFRNWHFWMVQPAESLGGELEIESSAAQEKVPVQTPLFRLLMKPLGYPAIT
jgi:hypothetical protein